MKSYFQVLLSVLLCQTAGVIGSTFTFSSIPNWYMYLNKASFNPPNWVFGPVWLTLYTLMGIAAYLVWKKRKTNKKAKFALNIFIFQLIFNLLWSIVFFGAHQIFFGLIIIIILWLSILITIVKFWQVSKAAALLLLPYLLWVSIATSLNYFVFILNR